MSKLTPVVLAYLYVVLDSVAESMTGPIMQFPSDAVARRTFQDAFASTTSVFSQHPDDYDLFAVGMIDTSTGLITSFDEPQLVLAGATIAEFLRNQQQREV